MVGNRTGAIAGRALRRPSIISHCFRIVLIVSVLVVLPMGVQGAIYVVDQTGDVAADGECDVDCYIRDALGLAVDGDTIYFASGLGAINVEATSLPVSASVTIDGNWTQVIQKGTSSGFAGFSISGDDVVIKELWIQNFDNVAGGGGVVVSDGNFTNMANITANQASLGAGVSVVNGATFTNYGDIHGNTADITSGGGVNVEGSSAYFDNFGNITGNSATTGGGGIGLTNGPSMSNNGTIANNTAGTSASGGGIYATNDGSIFNAGSIENNSATTSGGGIYLPGGSIENHGQIVDNQATTNGGGIYMATGSVVNYGNFIGNSAGTTGGAVEVGTGNLYNDGNITDNTAASEGGVVHTHSGSVVNNGTMDGNSAPYGGAIYNHASTTTNAGTISNNTATGSGGGGIYTFEGTIVNNGIIRDNEAWGSTGGGGIYQSVGTVTNTGTISFNNATDNGGGWYSVDSNVWNNGTVANNSADHGGGIFANNEHITNGGTISGNVAIGNGGGLYTATGTITNEGQIHNNTAVNGGGAFTNSGSIYNYENVIANYADGGHGGGLYTTSGLLENLGNVSLNIASFSGGGIYNQDGTTGNDNIIRGNSAGTEGGGIRTYSGFVENNGEIWGNEAEDGGGIFGYNGTLANVGELHNNSATNEGGAMYGEVGNLFNNGTLANNSANQRGGGILASSGTVNNNGEIRGNNASGIGGGIASSTGWVANFGTISSNDGVSGGGISNPGGTTTNYALGVIDNNTANTYYGGGIFANSGVIYNYGSVENNSATNSGGGILGSSGTFYNYGIITYNSAPTSGGFNVISGTGVNYGTISFNNATSSVGGGFRSDSGSFTNFGNVTNNTASSHGGGLYMSTGPFVNAATGLMDGNVAGSRGGAALASANMVNNGTISNNTAQNGGGVSTNSARIINNGTFENNTASSSGGGIDVTSSSGSIINYGLISFNTATYGGGVDGTLTNYGTINGNTASSNGGGGRVEPGATNHGNITGNSATDGGGLYTFSGDITNTGSIENNTASDDGGALVTSIGDFTNYGTIANNTATTLDGGAVYAATSATITNHATFKDNSAGNHGGGVYSYSGSVVNHGTMNQNSAEDGGAVMVRNNGGSATNYGNITGNTATAEGGGLTAYSTADITNYGNVTGNLGYNGGGVYVLAGDFVNYGKVDNNTANSTSGGVLADSGTLYNWGSINNNTGIWGGGVYSEGTVINQPSGTINHNSGQDGGAIQVDGGTITNHGELRSNSATGFGGAIVDFGGLTITNYGNITSNSATTGGAIYSGSGGTVNNHGNISTNGATGVGGGIYGAGSNGVTNYGLVDNNTALSGGGMNTIGSSTITNYGDVIFNNVTNHGAGIRAEGVTVAINHGNVRNNYAGLSGGGMQTGSGTITNYGNITGNQAPGGVGGGGIRVTGGTGTNYGNITNNSAAKGGAIWTESGTVHNYGLIADNEAPQGAGIRVNGGTVWNKAAGEILRNIATSFGGGIQGGSTSTIINDGLIHENVGTIDAGGIQGGGGPITNNGDITNNTGGYGGGIATNDGSVTNTGNIIGNLADVSNGGGVWSASGDISNTGDISDNTAATTGGGVYTNSGDVTNSLSGTIDDNSASHAGGAYSGTGSITNHGFIANNTVSGTGGGVSTNSGTVLNHGTIRDNTATTSGGGVHVSTNSEVTNYGNITNNTAGVSSSGGGIFANEADVNNHGNITDNWAGSTGGGIFGQLHVPVINTGLIDDNGASSAGGGVTIYGGTSRLDNSGQISNNTAFNGAGVYAYSGNTVINNGTVSHNVAGNNGGGIYGANNNASTLGGAYWADINITNNGHINNNMAENGGGIYNQLGTVENHGTIANNSATASTGEGGGVLLAEGTMVNRGIIRDNYAMGEGGGLWLDDMADLSTGLVFNNNASTKKNLRLVNNTQLSISGGSGSLTVSTPSALASSSPYRVEVFRGADCTPGGIGNVGANEYVTKKSIVTSKGGYFNLTFQGIAAAGDYVVQLHNLSGASIAASHVYSECDDVAAGSGGGGGGGAPPAADHTFVVDNIGDEPDDALGDDLCIADAIGPVRCTLRAAIEQANAITAADSEAIIEIEFAIKNSPSDSAQASGPHTISLASELPEIDGTVRMDGSTQAGSAVGDNVILTGTVDYALWLAGNSSTVEDLSIQTTGDYGIVAAGGGGHGIFGNTIGVNATGFGVGIGAPNTGVWINTSDVEVGSATDGNIIGGGEYGVRAGSCLSIYDCNFAYQPLDLDCADSQIVGNLIGVRSNGQGAPGLANSNGTWVFNCANIVIDQNTIRGWAWSHVALTSTCYDVLNVEGNHIVKRNLIGIDEDDESYELSPPASNDMFGLYVLCSTDNIIGGTSASLGNVISGMNGSVGDGIHYGTPTIDSITSRNKILNNFIGTNQAGTAPVANSGDGIFVSINTHTTIGAPFQGNLIAYNADNGIAVLGDVSVKGNTVLNNGGPGITITGFGSGSIVGGVESGAGNIIGKNGHEGIFIDSMASKAVVRGNFVGTDQNGADLGNDRAGIKIDRGAFKNTIGSTTPGGANIVANNIRGIEIERDFTFNPTNDDSAGCCNIVRGNLIDNDFPIDSQKWFELGGGFGPSPGVDWATPPPSISSATISGLLTISGTVQTNETNGVVIDAYKVGPCTGGYGPLTAYLGSVNSNGGQWNLTTAAPISIGQSIVVTASPWLPTNDSYSTSETSPCFTTTKATQTCTLASCSISSFSISTPDTAQVSTDVTPVAYKVIATNATGVPISNLNPAKHVSWNIDGPGAFNGNLLNPGRTAGTYTVTATLNAPGHPALVDQKTFTIEAGGVSQIRITPPTASIQVGGYVNFSGLAMDAFNNPLPEVPITWHIVSTIQPEWSMNIYGNLTAHSGPATAVIFAKAATGGNAYTSQAVVSIGAPPAPANQETKVNATPAARQIETVVKGEVKITKATVYASSVSKAGEGALLDVRPDVLGPVDESQLLQKAKARINQTLGADVQNFSLVIETQLANEGASALEVDEGKLANESKIGGPPPAVFINIRGTESGQTGAIEEMTSERVNQVLQNVTVQFKVPTSYFKLNNLDPRTVDVLEFSNGDLKARLTATNVGITVDRLHYIFEVEIEDFSTFAILGIALTNPIDFSSARGSGAAGGPPGPPPRFFAGQVGLQFDPKPGEIHVRPTESYDPRTLPSSVPPVKTQNVLQYIHIEPVGSSSGGRASMSVVLESRDVIHPDRAVLLHLVDGVWIPEARLYLEPDGDVFMANASFNCCSFFAVAFDVTPPEATVLSPTQVSERDPMIVQASDDLGIVRVEFIVDGESQGVDEEAPFLWRPSKGTDAGLHHVAVVATDFAGNSKQSDHAVLVEEREEPDLTGMFIALGLGGAVVLGCAAVVWMSRRGRWLEGVNLG